MGVKKCDALKILRGTFHKKSVKNEVEPAQKLIPTRGRVCGGLLISILGQISYFTPYFTHFWAGMYICEVKKTVYRSFVKKLDDRFMSNLGARALLLATPTSLYYLVFLNTG